MFSVLLAAVTFVWQRAFIQLFTGAEEVQNKWTSAQQGDEHPPPQQRAMLFYACVS